MAAIHVDLDGASDIFAVHGWPYRDKRDPLFESGLSNTLKFLKGAGIQATLFVIAKDLDDPRKRELLEGRELTPKRRHRVRRATLATNGVTDIAFKLRLNDIGFAVTVKVAVLHQQRVALGRLVFRV